ncbi:MAG: baseplate J/gp47 family protein [Aurantimonas coralicida]|nr:baseplate J/gp47 family protein [Aurantimonas coralicida]
MTTQRFASPELLALGPPPPLAAVPYETLLDRTIAKTAEEMAAAGIDWDVWSLQPNPGKVFGRVGVWRDELRRQAIDDAVSQTFLGSATGEFLDHRAADYGVLRRTVAYTGNQSGTAEPLRPSSVPPAWGWDGSARLWREDDDSLRTMARLAWEALSVAGPAGAYLYHAGAAHPLAWPERSRVYGPETGHVEPGEVLLVIQSRGGSGVPAREVIDSVAARLDAAFLTYSTGASIERPVRDDQAIRPLGARVMIRAAQPVTFYVTARIHVRPGPDPEAIRQTALARLQAYLEQRRSVGAMISREAIIAVLGVADATGLPVVEDVDLTWPAADIMPAYDQLPVASATVVEVEVR